MDLGNTSSRPMCEDVHPQLQGGSYNDYIILWGTKLNSTEAMVISSCLRQELLFVKKTVKNNSNGNSNWWFTLIAPHPVVDQIKRAWSSLSTPPSWSLCKALKDRPRPNPAQQPQSRIPLPTPVNVATQPIATTGVPPVQLVHEPSPPKALLASSSSPASQVRDTTGTPTQVYTPMEPSNVEEVFLEQNWHLPPILITGAQEDPPLIVEGNLEAD